MDTVIQLTSAQVLVGVSGIGVLQWLISLWVKTRLENSIRHEYDKQLESYKFSQLQRQKAESVARLFARWIKFRGREAEYLNEKEQADYFEELNQLAFELSLWISDEKLLTDIMRRLQNHQEARDVRSLIGDIRKLILDNPDDKFNAQEITVWPK